MEPMFDAARLSLAEQMNLEIQQASLGSLDRAHRAVPCVDIPELSALAVPGRSVLSVEKSVTYGPRAARSDRMNRG